MGAWGGGLYDSDEGRDLRDEVKVLVGIPKSGDELLEIILTSADQTTDFTEFDGSLFWLVLADQFERKGIVCKKVFDAATEIIATGQDLKNLKAMEMPERELKKRANVLQKLLDRLNNPKPARVLPVAPKLPAIDVKAGEIYTFPAMVGYEGGDRLAFGFSTYYKNWDDINAYRKTFQPDCWGAFVILKTGRLYNWLPWTVYCPLSVPLDHSASLVEAIDAELFINNTFEQCACMCKASAQHLKRMQARRIGEVFLNEQKIAPFIPPASLIAREAKTARHISSHALNIVISAIERPYGPRLAELLKP